MTMQGRIGAVFLQLVVERSKVAVVRRAVVAGAQREGADGADSGHAERAQENLSTAHAVTPKS
jgi:hypothetical protein